MLLQFGKIALKDFYNFSSGLSLEGFAKSVGIADEVKLAYPYERYKNMEELHETTEFPAYAEFKN